MFRNKKNVEPCQTLANISCFSFQYQAFFNGNLNELCSNQCPPECDSVFYIPSVSASQYPSKVYGSYLLKNPKIISKFKNRTNLTLQDLKDNMIYLSVFYQELNYRTFYEVSKMEIIDLVSNVGGTLGLFLGMSFLSFIEIVDLIFNILICLFRCNSSNRIGN